MPYHYSLWETETNANPAATTKRRCIAGITRTAIRDIADDTAPVSSIKWTAAKWILRFGVMALLGWNWKEKVYYRARSNMSDKFIMALNTWRRDPEKQANPTAINIVYIDAFKAANEYVWECSTAEYDDVIDVRVIICHFMAHDAALSDNIKQSNANYINQKSVLAYPNRGERLLKVKQDVSEWIWRRIETLLSRD